ncbi:hypothetical protein C5167_048151 [Papaver somniferum]|uniref:Uncharacterized protein n=1 Tax=Papaver somniferum TaxID=3469 RepID=A0A4Y7KK05_PAPSO|nr:heat shock cognate 70 kDa protein-like [Papaver somniferum]RZC72670.1 hypothetical protein C5167_048151 [Papaver somniferum]
MAQKKAAIGIDFGTTLCRVAVCKEGKVEVIATIPSFIAFGDNLTAPLFGDEAQDQMHSNPLNTVFHVTRLMGKKMADHALKEDKKLWPFKVVFPDFDDNEEPKVEVQFDGASKKLSAVEISSMFLKKLKSIAEQHLGENDVKDVVISVPSFFTDFQRRAMKAAAVKAGMNLMRILNETSAVAIDYGVHREGLKDLEEKRKRAHIDLNEEYHVNKKRRITEEIVKEIEENILVVDLGGGALSVAIVHIKEDNTGRKLRVKSVAGDTHLGGKDLDDHIIRLCLDEFTEMYKDVADIFTNSDDAEDVARSFSILRSECQKAKITLSSGVDGVATIEVESFYNGKNLVYSLSRDKFEEISKDFLDKCKGVIRQCLRDDQSSVIKKVILVGGSAKLPGIERLMESFLFGGIIEFEGKSIIPESAVARGAAIHAALLSANATRKKAIKYVLSDVTAFDILIETSSGKKILVARNTTLPTQADYSFTTSLENQMTVEVRVYEGVQGWDYKYNNFLGMFTIGNIPPAPKGWPKIAATFKIDRDGVLDGFALDTLDPTERALGFKEWLPNPSNVPFRYTPGYNGYKCAVTVTKGRFTDGDIKEMADRAAVAEPINNEVITVLES